MNKKVAGASSSHTQQHWEQDAPATTPKLRFPEFRGTEGWEVTKLGKHVNIQRSYNPTGQSLFSKRRYAFVKVEDLNNCVKYQLSGREFHDYSDALIPTNSVVFPKRGAAIELNKIRITAIDILIDTNLMALTPKDELNVEFLFYYLSQVGLSQIADTSTIPQINNKHIIPFDFLLPDLTEQQRIADCLSSLDALMAAQARKVDALKSHKKGLMQQLFPRAGETQPRLRFPEFQDAGGWEIKAGNALFDQINDRNPEPGLPVLAITQEHGAIPRHLIDYHVSVSEKSIESYKVVRNGDFIISLRSFQGGIEYSTYSGICSPAYVILRGRGNGTDVYFRYYLKTDRFIQILTKNLEGLRDGKMVSYTQFSELQIPTPTLAEQQRIADCLSSLDALITAETHKLAALKTHKRGLMQQLFPTVAGASSSGDTHAREQDAPATHP